MSDAREQMKESLTAFRAVFRNPNLRRLQLAWAGSNLGTWAYGIALAVFAYDRGGAVAVGLVGLLRWIPAAIVAPFMGVLGDRFPRRRVMVASDLGRVVVISAGALAILAETSPSIVYGLAALGVIIATAFRPAQAAIIPRLAETPRELAASNVASSTIEAVGMFAGPAVGGIVLAVSGPAAVFGLAAATFLWSAAMIGRIRTDADGGPTGRNPAAPDTDADADADADPDADADADAGAQPTDDAEAPAPSFLAQISAGFVTILKEPGPRLLVGLFSAQTVIAGALSVFIVVIARELLDRGDAWVGILSAAIGVGGIIGAGVTAALIGRNRLALDFGVGVMLWGIPLIVIGVWPEPWVAIAAMVLLGLGNTMVDVSGDTLLQRSVPDEVLARVFGVLETLILLTVAIGAIAAPGLVALLGNRSALVVLGLFLPTVVGLRWRKLRALDADGRPPVREVALLRGIEIFSGLPEAVVEHLAGRLVSFTVPAGAELFAQGDAGDRFYVVAGGAVEIVKDGRPVLDVRAGGSFGEIALLHEVPRQAGARALVDTEVLALEGGDFVAAVTGHAPSRDAAAAVIRSYGVGSLPR